MQIGCTLRGKIGDFWELADNQRFETQKAGQFYAVRLPIAFPMGMQTQTGLDNPVGSVYRLFLLTCSFGFVNPNGTAHLDDAGQS